MKAVDLFAGFGGLTLAASRAGVDVVWAANHWPLAVRVHAANHPTAEHACQDLRQADWTRLPRYDLLLAAPACQGHSEASQPKRRPYHDEMRATAWAVVDCADATNPRALVVENVPAFRRWRLFPIWRAALEKLGYHVSEHLACASRHGVPQLRTRLFVVGLRKPRPLGIGAREREPLAFGPCIDWDAPGWRPVHAASVNARERIERARARLRAERFLSQHVTNHPGVGLDEPIRTITTKDQWVVVDGDRYRPLTVRETARAMSFPDSYALPPEIGRRDAILGFGNAVPPELGHDVVAAVAEAA